MLQFVDHLKPLAETRIKTQVYWVGMILFEKIIIKKYGYSDKEMLQERVDSDCNLLLPNT
jgi:hypothetical protein